MPGYAQRAPSDLGARGHRLWREIASEHTLNPIGLQLLRQACREADLVDRIQSELEPGPLTVRGSLGQEVASPLVSEIRQHRACLAMLLRALKLDDAGIGSGTRSARSSDAARKAARARWGTPIA